jgi:hypothetical protein
MKEYRNTCAAIVALGMTLMLTGTVQAAPPAGGPPGHDPTEVTGTVAVSNFPATQNVTVNNEVDVNVTNSRRIQIRIVGESSSDGGPVTGVIQRADGQGNFANVPVGLKLVLTDFIVSIGVPNDPVIGDNDDFLANIGRVPAGGACTGSSERRWQYRVFRRDQIVASLATGLEYYAGERVCLATGSQGQAPRNVGVVYQIMGYLTDAQ